LNPVPDAQVCVFDGTYYKITTTNYISKTSLYIAFPMYSWGPWPLKILMFALLVTSDIAADIDIKILGVPPPRLGMPFLDSDTCTKRRGVIYFCQGFLPCMMPSMDG
jgi:hypothetical protein